MIEKYPLCSLVVSSGTAYAVDQSQWRSAAFSGGPSPDRAGELGFLYARRNAATIVRMRIGMLLGCNR